MSGNLKGSAAGDEVTVLDSVLDRTHTIAHSVLDLGNCVHVGAWTEKKNSTWCQPGFCEVGRE